MTDQIINLTSNPVLGKLDEENTLLKKRIEELDELRQHFEEKFTEQCQINMKLQAQVKELEAALTEVIEAQHSGFIDNCSDETQRLYTNGRENDE